MQQCLQCSEINRKKLMRQRKLVTILIDLTKKLRSLRSLVLRIRDLLEDLLQSE